MKTNSRNFPGEQLKKPSMQKYLVTSHLIGEKVEILVIKECVVWLEEYKSVFPGQGALTHIAHTVAP